MVRIIFSREVLAGIFLSVVFITGYALAMRGLVVISPAF
jgi:hypothetical protein